MFQFKLLIVEYEMGDDQFGVLALIVMKRV